MQEAEVAAGDADDGSDGLGVGEVVGVECQPELASVPVRPQLHCGAYEVGIAESPENWDELYLPDETAGHT